jgi:hypothetical protein
MTVALLQKIVCLNSASCEIFMLEDEGVLRTMYCVKM